MHTEYVETVHRPSQLRVRIAAPSRQAVLLCCLRTAGVFFTTHTSGMLSAWDLVYKHSEPTLQVSSWRQAPALFKSLNLQVWRSVALHAVESLDTCCAEGPRFRA